MAPVTPRILKPYTTLLFNVADVARRRGHPLWRARALPRGPWRWLSRAPQREPRPPLLPALPSQPCQTPLPPRAPRLVFTVV